MHTRYYGLTSRVPLAREACLDAEPSDVVAEPHTEPVIGHIVDDAQYEHVTLERRVCGVGPRIGNLEPFRWERLEHHCKAVGCGYVLDAAVPTCRLDRCAVHK